MINAAQKDAFDHDGFVLINSVVSDQELAILRQKAKALYSAAKSGKISKIRVYDDMPRILGGLNVAGIEDPFFYFPEIASWLRESKFGEILKSLTGWTGAELEVARIHTNGRFKNKSFWHRDALTSDYESSVVAVVYLENEAGFRIIPSHERASRADLSDGDAIQARYCFGRMNGEAIVRASHGDAFLFRSYLLHQAWSTRPRTHLHLRFKRSEERGFDTAEWASFRFEQCQDFNPESTTLRNRIVRLIKYLLPFPNQSNIYQR